MNTETTAKTNGTGWYSLTGHEPNAGTYEFLTKYAGSTTYAASTAPKYATVTVTVS